LNEYRYSVLFDTDKNANTGCDVAVDDLNINTTVHGIDQIARVTIAHTPECTTTSGSVCSVFGGWEVIGITREACLGNNTFGPPQFVSPGFWPVGQDNGVDGADVIEGFVPLADLGDPSQVRVVFTASVATPGSDVLLSTNGQLGGPDILFDTVPRPAPALSVAGVVTCVLLLGMVAWWTLRRRTSLQRALLLALLVTVGAATAWALTIGMDGDVADWTGLAPVGRDLVGDSSTGDSGEDIVAAFMTADKTNVYFRVDVNNLAFCGDGICDSGETFANCPIDCGD
jgi:hypothetical protein